MLINTDPYREKQVCRICNRSKKFIKKIGPIKLTNQSNPLARHDGQTYTNINVEIKNINDYYFNSIYDNILLPINKVIYNDFEDLIYIVKCLDVVVYAIISDLTYDVVLINNKKHFLVPKLEFKLIYKKRNILYE